MKKIYFLSLFFLIVTFTNGYCQTWQWGKRGGSFDTNSTSDETVESMATDHNGNLYLLAPVGINGLQVDGVPKLGYSNRDYMIASFSCGGDYRWSRIIGGGGDDTMERIQTDAQGNVYAVGKIRRSSNAYFGSETGNDIVLPFSHSSVNLNKQSLFLVKYNLEGEMQWMRMPQPEDISYANAFGNSYSLDLQVDPQGNSYWLCRIPPGTYANGAFVNTLEGSNYFIFQYNSNGEFVEAHSFDLNSENNYPYLKMVRNHTSGTCYIGGYVPYGAVPPVIGGEAVTNSMFLAAFDNNGAFLWKQENTGDSGEISDLCIDNANNLYITGVSHNGDTFAGAGFTSAYPHGFPMLVKLTADGQLLWATNAETQSVNKAWAIALNGNEVAIAGSHAIIDWQGQSLSQEDNEGYDVLLARFNKNDGTIIQLADIESNFGYWDYGTSLTADPYGNYYMGGMFDNFLYVAEGNTLIDGAEETDFFVAKYGTDNCSCAMPQPSFGVSPGSSDMAFDFSYTGSDYDSISWDFGDGETLEEENPQHTYSESGSYTVCVTVSNACGTEEYCGDVNAMLELGSRQLASVKAYPNPVSDMLTVTGDTELSYTLYSILGSEILNGIIPEGKGHIKFDGVAPGWYLLKLQDNSGGQKTVKLFKN